MGKELDLDDGAAWAGERAQEELRRLRQSEREGWRQADEIAQERDRLVQYLETIRAPA